MSNFDDAKFEAAKQRMIEDSNAEYERLNAEMDEQEQREIERKGWNGVQDVVNERGGE